MGRRCIIVGAILPLLMCGNVLAQHNADQLVAQKHYELGAQLYKTSNYTRALAEFQEAYRLSKKPGLLFNIARCHEVMASLEQAVKHYRLYLAQVPRASNRSLVESRLRNLENVLAARKAKEPKPAPAPPKAPPPEPRSEPVKPAPAPPRAAPDAPGRVDVTRSTATAPRRWKKTAGWVALGTGGALLVTGIVFGAMASSKWSDYKEAAKTTPYELLGDLRDEGEALESTQIGLMVAGGVLAAAGGGLLLWHHMGRKKKDEQVTATIVAPLISHSTVGLMGRIQF